MCPPSTSTAMPSGSRHSVTMTLRLDPSGFSVTMRLSLASRTNKRPTTVLVSGARLDLDACNSDILVLLSSFIAPQARRGSNTQRRRFARPGRLFALDPQPVPRQVGDGDHHEAVCLAEPNQVRNAGHGAVVVDDLADHARGAQAGQAGQIDGRLGLPPPLQDAAGAGAEWEDVSRPGEVVRRSAGGHGGPDCSRPVVGRDAGGDAAALNVDRDRE